MPAHNRKYVTPTAIRVNGKWRTNPLYTTYTSMLARCRPNHKHANRYFNRGITVCQEWSKGNFDAFADWAEAHGFKHGLDLDRIDNDKGYSPDNCQFITHKENTQKRDKPHASKVAAQSYRRTKRNCRACVVEGIGRFETVTEAAKTLGLTVGYVSNILHNYRDRDYGRLKGKISYV